MMPIGSNELCQGLCFLDLYKGDGNVKLIEFHVPQSTHTTPDTWQATIHYS